MPSFDPGIALDGVFALLLAMALTAMIIWLFGRPSDD